MNPHNIIINSLIEYDKRQEVIQYLKNNCKCEVTYTKNEFEKSIFTFIHHDTDEIILKTEVESVGSFYEKYNVWHWAWTSPILLNSQNNLSKKIIKYAIDLPPEMSYIRSILITSKGIVKDWFQIDINLAISGFIVKQPYIYVLSNFDGEYHSYHFYFLLNKEELDKIYDEKHAGKLDVYDDIDLEE